MILTRMIPLYCLLAFSAWQYTFAQREETRETNAAKRELQILLDQLDKGNRRERESAAAQLGECNDLLIERLIEIAKEPTAKAPPMNGVGENRFERWNPPRALAFQLLGHMRTLRAIPVAGKSLAYKPESLVVQTDEGLGRLRSFPAAYLVFQLKRAGISALLDELASRPNQEMSDSEMTALLELFQKTFSDREAAADFLDWFSSIPTGTKDSKVIAMLRSELSRRP